MWRGLRRWRRRAPILLGLAVAMVAPPTGGTAATKPESCRRVELVDAATGDAVVGAEDIVADPVTGRLYLAAFDRWALEDALDADAERLPQGGIYAAPLDAVAAASESLQVTRLAGGDSEDFHPHGIAVHHGGHRHRLFAINHVHGRADGRWRKDTRIEVYEPTPDGLLHRARLDAATLCQANDLAPLSADDLLMTRDHGACGRLGMLAEDVLGLRHAELLLATLPDEDRPAGTAPLVEDLGFANGVAVSPDGDKLAVAATRQKHVRIYDIPRLLRAPAGEPTRVVRLDGGPDNLNWAPDGRILAALHPSLLDAGMARHRWFGQRRSGTRVVAIDPDSGAVDTLIDDPEGERLNAGTAATMWEDTLAVGAVLDSALLVCGIAGPEAPSRLRRR